MLISSPQGHAVPSRPFDQRQSTRYEPSKVDACLSWREKSPGIEAESPHPLDSADPANLSLFALLLDISHTGASIALDRVPRAEDGVRLRLDGGALSDWTEAEVVGVTTTARGPHLIRLAFRSPCQFETLRAAVCD